MPPAGLDAALAVCLLALTGVYVHLAVDLGRHPEEDAAMLLRYSGHLARGYGIVWNIGEPPVDGATDFLFMLLVAGLHRLGSSLETAAHGVGLVAHGALVLLVFCGARRLFQASRAWALVPAAYVAIGPGLRHLAAAYGSPLFALLALVAFTLATSHDRAVPPADGGADRRRALSFAMAALALGLARPEGVFLGAFVLFAVAALRRGRGTRSWVVAYLAVHLTLGLGYFLWRCIYFGQPLPNPYYRKGSFLLHWHSLHVAGRDVWHLAWPFLLACAAGLLVREARRAAAFVLVPTALFTSLWILVSDETNYFMRFRYPLLPILALGSVPVGQALAASVSRWRPSLGRLRTLRWPAALAAAAAAAVGEHVAYRYIAPQRMGLYDAALVLHDYVREDYTLATTEAGLLPLYSGWRTIDTWGLNDRRIARTGTIDAAELDHYHPEVILMHAYFSPGVSDSDPRVMHRGLGPRWYQMVRTLMDYAEAHDYVLAACFGRNEWDTHYYYVRRGFPRSDEIVARLRGLDYYWDGEPTIDFAAGPPDRQNPTPAAAGGAQSRAQDDKQHGA